MERGPMALFGAIVAVGLGPALWLGAQFGAVDIQPTRPPGVTEQQPASEQLLGGAGAGDDTTGADDAVIRTTPQADVKRLTDRPAHRTSTSPTPSPSSDDQKPAPSESSRPAPTASNDSGGPSTPPTEDGESEGPSLPPAPPSEVDPSEPAGDTSGVAAGETS